VSAPYLNGARPNYPIIGDGDCNVSKLCDMLGADVSGEPGDRTAADNQTVRNVFVIGPDEKVELVLVYPMTTGRNFDEVLRVIDSLQLTAAHTVSTPVNWRQGEDVIIAGSVSDEQAKKLFGSWEAPRPYIRIERARGVDDRAHRELDRVATADGGSTRRAANGVHWVEPPIRRPGRSVRSETKNDLLNRAFTAECSSPGPAVRR
jgi:C-terminal domain of 1-Cys peroxiredoxin